MVDKNNNEITFTKAAMFVNNKRVKDYAKEIKPKSRSVNVDQRVMPTLAGMPRIIYKNSRHLKEDKPYGIRDNSGYLFFFVDISHYEGQDERYEEELKQQQLLAEYLLAELSKCSA